MASPRGAFLLLPDCSHLRAFPRGACGQQAGAGTGAGEKRDHGEVVRMSGRVLVTGASGRAGGVMVRRLRDAGVPVRAAIHYPDHDAESRAAAVDYVEVDFERPETLDTAFDGVEKAVLITPEETTMVAHDGAPRARRRACRCGLPGSRLVHPRRVRRRRPAARLASRGRGDRRRVADPVGDPAAQLLHAELRHHVRAEHLHARRLLHADGQRDGSATSTVATSPTRRPRSCSAGGHEDAIVLADRSRRRSRTTRSPTS